MSHQKLTIMNKIILLFLAGLSFFTLSAQNKKLPVIDMHVHVYSPHNYWGGSDFVLEDTVLYSPKNYDEHIKSVVQQMEQYNIVLSYASGNFEALDSINKNYPNLFLPSAEIWPTEELLTDNTFLNTLKSKIKIGEVVSIGEVANFYTGFKPNDPIMDTLYRLAETYDLPIGLHFAPGPPGSQLSTSPNARLEYANPFLLQDVLIKYPKLRVCMMHAGLPFYEDETFAMLFMFPTNLYVDISALTWYKNYSTVSLTEFLKKAVNSKSTEKIFCNFN